MRFPHSVVTTGSLWLSVVVGSLTLVPRSAVSAWTVGTPIVTYWAGPGYDSSVPLTETAARQMADFGINLVWASSASEVDLAGRFGLRAMYQNRGVFVPEYLDGGTLQQHIDRAVGELRTKPAMYAYFLADEFSPKRFAPLRSLKDYLDKLDPDHVAYMDIFPTYGAPIEGLDYATYLNRYVDTVKPALLSYNHYQFRIGADWSGYLHNLAIIREKAKSKSIPFMNIVQASAWVDSRLPTAAEERYLVYTTLAYGAQGISYYVWCWPPCPDIVGGIVNANGAPTPIYETLKQANREFVAIAKQYQPLQSIGAYLKGYRADKLPPGTVALPADSPFDIREVTNNMAYKEGEPLRGVLFGFFNKDGAALSAATLAIVVNLDCTAGKTYTITGPNKLSVFDAAKGKWMPAGADQVALSLPPGGGVLVGLTSSVSSQ